MCLFVVVVLVGTQGEIAFLAKQSEEERKKVEGREVEEKRQQRSKAIHRGSFPVPATAHAHTLSRCAPHLLYLCDSVSLPLVFAPRGSLLSPASFILCLCDSFCNCLIVSKWQSRCEPWVPIPLQKSTVPRRKEEKQGHDGIDWPLLFCFGLVEVLTFALHACLHGVGVDLCCWLRFAVFFAIGALVMLGTCEHSGSAV